MRQVIFTQEGVLPSGPFSQAVTLNGVVYISGQGSFQPGTSTFKPGIFREQAQQTFQNIGVLLKASGSSFEHVVKVNVFLKDVLNFAEMNEIFKTFFKEPYPARTPVQAVLLGNMQIEVDCIAEVPAK